MRHLLMKEAARKLLANPYTFKYLDEAAVLRIARVAMKGEDHEGSETLSKVGEQGVN